MSKVQFNFLLDTDLLEEFKATAEAQDLSGAQLLRKLMRCEIIRRDTGGGDR